MKKIADLEKRWKIYKYRTAVFYVFLVLSVAFVIMLGIFIESKFSGDSASDGRESTQPAQSTTTSNLTNENANPNPAPTTYPRANESVNLPQANANLDCRQVITERLNVRSESNFHSNAVGYYSRNAIFCVNNIAANGMLKTPNGWVSGNRNYSRVVNLSMPVDNGFTKHRGTQAQARIQSQRNIPQSDIEEVRVFDKPNRANFTNTAPTARIPQRPLITSQSLSKEKMIEFKEADFRNTKDYDTAIYIAKFYYDAKNYDKSIQWALNASNADSRGKQKTESFIIYAKSLYFSGKKEQGIEVLTNYISSTNAAPEAIDTLNKMKEGTI